ncbi:MAG TPA: cupin domain-containing protein [Gemmatimonadaceae bacterium]|jgi:quercetin dioxygenase-like cupin family protein|nr:cupin domain-containing protein [Gemmatimonadaceae bacterium]
MMFAASLRPHRVLVVVAVTAAGALACKDTTTPRELSSAGIGGPSFTAAVGFTGATVGRGNIGAFHIKSRSDGYNVDLKSKDNSDILVTNLAIAAGGHSGWHSHPGPVLVVVKTGAITLYHENDPSCTGQRYTAGTVFVEEGGVVHIARNEGTVDETMVASSFLPAGAPGRIDEAAPGNCPF